MKIENKNTRKKRANVERKKKEKKNAKHTHTCQNVFHTVNVKNVKCDQLSVKFSIGFP